MRKRPHLPWNLAMRVDRVNGEERPGTEDTATWQVIYPEFQRYLSQESIIIPVVLTSTKGHAAMGILVHQRAFLYCE